MNTTYKYNPSPWIADGQKEQDATPLAAATAAS